MRITTMQRYPVKSMLGQRLDEARVQEAGFAADRGLAVIDRATGLVATASIRGCGGACSRTRRWPGTAGW